MANTKLTSSKSTIPVGDIQFYQAIEPPLKAAKYSLSVKQEVTNVPNPGGPATPTYTAPKTLQVTGPQFNIPASTIHAMYPAPLAVGDYQRVMPNIVFSNFSLPWSRPIDPNDTDGNMNTPWMGLLTVYPTDVEKDATGLTKDNKVFFPPPMTISQFLEPAAGTLIPALNEDDILIDKEKTQLTVVEMDLDYFRSIAPTLEDLQYLAHGRQVNTGGKVMLGMDADGFFSLLIGNRLPMAGTENGNSVNKILLVSFEGLSKNLRGSPRPPSDITKIRLILFSSWKVTCTPSKSSFLSEMAALCDPGHGGVQLMQMPGEISKLTNETAKVALNTGHTALQNDMRIGEEATSWYRGPLVPTPTKRDEGQFGTYLYGDRAMHYDPKTGIFNHSYASAWQIGRLLALSDGAFAHAFFKWRNLYIQLWLRLTAEQPVVEVANKMMGTAKGELEPALQGSLPSSVQVMLAKGIRNVDWPQYTSRKARVLGDHLPGVLKKEDLEHFCNSDEDPLLTLLKRKK